MLYYILIYLNFHPFEESCLNPCHIVDIPFQGNTAFRCTPVSADYNFVYRRPTVVPYKLLIHK